jgi:succinate dehydrogenase / fumarate reductase, iron-sulfur subunit
MTDHASHPGDLGRRGFLVRTIQGLHAVMGATLAFVLGRAALAPAFARREAQWLHAGDLASLQDDVPVPVTLRVARPDGASEAVDRRVVYVVRSGDGAVRAFDSTCTHLGCRTRFNPESNHIECPCHGGVYDTTGAVVSGPPPEPLATLPTRLNGDQVLIQV